MDQNEWKDGKVERKIGNSKWNNEMQDDIWKYKGLRQIMNRNDGKQDRMKRM